MNAVTPTRRGFLTGGALIFGMTLPIGGRAARAAAGPAAAEAIQPNAFVKIAPDNSVTVIIKHIEFGQGPATGLATLVADEMDADWGQMRVEMAPANDPLYKNLMFGTMGTGGSTAMANSWTQMRTAGASARAMLIEAAARRWGVKADAVSVAKGVVSAGDRRATFGELVADAAKLTPPEKPVLKTPEQWTLIGTDVPKVDTAIKTDGSARFTMDLKPGGTVQTAILHPPAFGATLKSMDDAAALAVPGVRAVKAIPRGIVVYADSFHAAQLGRAALTAEWDMAKAETRSSEAMAQSYIAAAAKPGRVVAKETRGDLNQTGVRTVEAAYVFPFLAHAPMEPLDIIIHAQDGKADVWMGSQFQVGEMKAIGGVLGLSPDKVTLHQQYAGGSFGRRAEPDNGFVVEAAMAAKAFGQPVPVKHVWTRENDIRGGRYRPLTVHKLTGMVDAAGNVVGWDQVIAAQSFMLPPPTEGQTQERDDASMYEGSGPENYAIPNTRLSCHVMQNGVPTLWWRSVGHTHTAYAGETFIDELLSIGSKDAVEGRLALLKDVRAKGVLTRVAERSGWGRALGEGRALGVAVHKSFGTYVAQVAEVSKGKDGLPRVHKVWCAVDCGVPVNPNVIRAQMEGGIGFGIGHALYAEVTIAEGGMVDQGNFNDYRSLRIHEMPEVEVDIIKSGADPTGVGEPGVPPSAPAVANAWRKLTGRAVRRLPFTHTDNTGNVA
ncbi:xanthine dehydrogenase family protein molybdopterin-binding subunit [Sphingomonas sp. BGYR3]|uniref:xanthine dehydrogenase family protein molybdopterin-binding subunit n=1 Tax=Sphingomonas sp. BGYR3 TaxID=2975483 RepID=UPI0021A32391|nr:xanthine dehydrogenase family protein molybdopterin-binding subunit [Sphingomonas sp. BGYR3]MDG5489032.1 xanthine dehydrogenase family protein molybdopterin-binding subunit [Sphingomonas sp. BGYR3]